MNTFGERLAYFIELVGMRPAEFSREVGYNRPDKIYHAIDNKFKLSLESLEDVAARFPELNLDWLIRGEGEPLKSSVQLRLLEVRSSLLLHQEAVAQLIQQLEKMQGA